MGDILITQNKIVGWKLEKCSCMLQYGWYFDNSKDFGGVKIWNMSIYVYLCCSMGDMLITQRILVGWQFEKCPFMSIYVHLCCNMGDILIIQTKISGVKNWKMSIYVHLCCSMGDMLIIQMGRKQISTKWGHILSGVAFEFNCIIGKTHILCGRGTLYIYVCWNPFGQGFNSILLVKDLGDVGCFLRWVHGTNMEPLAKRDSHQ